MKKIRLEELGTFARGISKHRPRNAPELYESGGYPLVQTGDITSAQFHIESHSQEYNKQGILQSKMWPKGTLAITIAANIAETGILSYPMAFPDSVVGFNSYEGKSTNEFVHYLLSNFRKNIQANVRSTGSIQDNINLQFLNNLELEVPDFRDQRAIVNVLSSIDNKIELNRKINDELYHIANTIYNYWFNGFNFPDKVGRPYHASGGAMAYSKNTKRDIPVDWEVNPLKDIASIVTGKTPNTKDHKNYSKNDYMFIGPEELIGNPLSIESSTKYISQHGFESIKSNTISGESVLVSCIGVIGRIGFTNHIVATNQQINSLTNFVSNNLSYYVYFYLRSISTSLQYLAGNTVMPILSKSIFEEIKIVIPDTKVLNVFSNQIRPLFAQIQQNKQESVELAQLRDWLLPLLMNGQVISNDL